MSGATGGDSVRFREPLGIVFLFCERGSILFFLTAFESVKFLPGI